MSKTTLVTLFRRCTKNRYCNIKSRNSLSFFHSKEEIFISTILNKYYINIKVYSKNSCQREMLRKRQSFLIKKINQLYTLYNVSVAFLIRFDYEILFYSSNINTNYFAIVIVSFANIFFVICF